MNSKGIVIELGTWRLQLLRYLLVDLIVLPTSC